MKKFLFSLLFVFSLNIVSAQSPLMATLDHNGEISHFYSTNAFVAAMAAATDGDIITLSSGAFIGTDISKTITLRGAGMDSEFGEPTIINSGVSITATDTTHVLTIEDIKFQKHFYINGVIKNSKLKKCHFFSSFRKVSSASISGLTIENCRVYEDFTFDNNSNGKCQNVKILNSVVTDVYFLNNTGAQFINCILSGGMIRIAYSEIWNSILFITNSESALPATTMAYNSISYNTYRSSGGAFSNIPNSTNWHIDSSTTKIFANESLNTSGTTIANKTSFELTDEVKAAYLGTDGTEVGVYGGFLPYTSKPSNPKITKCNVAQKSTADGKLSVEIEVSAQE